MYFRNPENLSELFHIYSLLKPISNLYPDFSNWYWDKVVTGVLLGKDKIIIAENKAEIIGVSIIKNSPNENKLRALRIVDKFQKTGAGLYLMDESLKELGDSKPIVSVADEMINEYSRMFINRYDFNLTHVYNGLYRKNHLEYEFNGNKNLKDKSIYF